ncbi:3'-phosphoadenosine 5'-phosphosulfate sulfotransferase (PAPS reductase)/FAD synthetase and related enzyme [Hahella chejuensis KCTC 2396]|uniref:3'-phosphoadenosine 5'-phosphosulfate sulfotransferase (PAPS reductase)/FAD synthetase and related enzyme n=1 Tax=Hahella chejuensis (strain KCTC 2396) TaxID=349521 RepID=Q2S6R6_HAHCH|nr:DNA phosphorothioation system sulfurtransferase DndC [Hahella chejuensis]ABC33658.1 3'-phosphoadenosine 5'-phosphosulfate sulfotransferase (PAPS reductase)/FAD synthetase and related enzyme [Hahella chejuensis KCTC 2396]
MSQRKTLYPSMDKMLEASAFAGRPALDLILEIQSLYLENDKPWVIGFSGGKDSTTVLSLIYVALTGLPEAKRHKHIYVISSDTLVETPMVVDMINDSIEAINRNAQDKKLPISAHVVYPAWNETFWVNLLGKGYPAPTQNFRWCTERMKIDPVSTFIKDKIARFGEVIVVLGARSQESSSRAQVIAKHKIEGSSLSRHSSLPGAFTYMPIEDWTFDEVWMYLLGAPAPWGGDHFELFELYKDSSAGECPLVIDTNTPSCGNSRFGCWTCTVVTKDRAIEGLIDSGEVWLKKLKSFRNKLFKTTLPENKNEYRNFKRRTGRIQYARGAIDNDNIAEIKTIPGPYLLEYRKQWLKELLTIEKNLIEEGRKIQLIHPEELHAIRKEWMFDPNEPDWSDELPKIYHSVYGEDLDWVEHDSGAFSQADADLIAELSAENGVPAELVMKLLELELSMDGLSRRKGLFNKIENLLKNDWGSKEDIQAAKAAATHTSDFKNKLKTELNTESSDLHLKSVYDEQLKALTKEYEALS